ncbi:hypothetical protein [Paenibacillus sp. GM2]|uniref:hypothetical protein n=1 Tax=Paenibacillus sp. GM2 TaxID=1622070 RepID=UPI000839517E|nr:hypothetical protein [Paenibacillus sp. GM2]
MRLETGTTARLKFQEPKQDIRRPAEYMFELGKEQTDNPSNKSKESSGKLVTCRENGYIRQYIVRADGSRILLSEMQEPQSDAAPQRQEGDKALHSEQEGSMDQNTKDMIQLLNVQAGIATDYRKKSAHLAASYNVL